MYNFHFRSFHCLLQNLKKVLVNYFWGHAKFQKILTFLTVRARVDLIVVAPRKNVFFHNSPKVVVGHGLKDYGVKNLFTM